MFNLLSINSQEITSKILDYIEEKEKDPYEIPDKKNLNTENFRIGMHPDTYNLLTQTGMIKSSFPQQITKPKIKDIKIVLDNSVPLGDAYVAVVLD